MELLDVKDNLERAIDSNKDKHEASSSLYEGIFNSKKKKVLFSHQRYWIKFYSRMVLHKSIV